MLTEVTVFCCFVKLGHFFPKPEMDVCCFFANATREQSRCCWKKQQRLKKINLRAGFELESSLTEERGYDQK
jgi:hypothetical protein